MGDLAKYRRLHNNPIKVPDLVEGYTWNEPLPILPPYTKLQFRFGTLPLEEGREVTITLLFNPDCSKVLKFTP